MSGASLRSERKNSTFVLECRGFMAHCYYQGLPCYYYYTPFLWRYAYSLWGKLATACVVFAGGLKRGGLRRRIEVVTVSADLSPEALFAVSAAALSCLAFLFSDVVEDFRTMKFMALIFPEKVFPEQVSL